MKNEPRIRKGARELICGVLGSAIIAFGAVAQSQAPSNKCFVNFQTSCAGTFDTDTIDQGRTCTNGNNSMPCGDIILSDDDITDFRAAEPGEPGQKPPLQMPCGSVSILVWKFSCSGGGSSGTCQDLGINTFTCQGRCVMGDPCTGTNAEM